MNKIVAILGIIVLLTLGGLFFCAGFFTGTTMSPTKIAADAEAQADSEKKITTKDVEDVIDPKSTTISDKIMEILSSAADTATSKISDAIDNTGKQNASKDKSQLTMDSLLREIMASHAENDNCSPEKTLEQINSPKSVDPNSLQGKKIVFVGYFKNKIAFQVQKLLVGKGYRAHVEVSKAGDNESFIFCGPFKKEANAKNLVKWLQKHNFLEARIVSVSDEAIEETIYDFVNDDDNNMPENTEKSAVPIYVAPPQQPVAPVQTAAQQPQIQQAPEQQNPVLPQLQQQAIQQQQQIIQPQPVQPQQQFPIQQIQVPQIGS
ncbi:MAG: hypothetical protein LBP41_03675 [Holosporaceae bacterium]|jgi:hypothetical protein|nr:hypothetical protein [Holosporaceae bacterium]